MMNMIGIIVTIVKDAMIVIVVLSVEMEPLGCFGFGFIVCGFSFVCCLLRLLICIRFTWSVIVLIDGVVVSVVEVVSVDGSCWMNGCESESRVVESIGIMMQHVGDELRDRVTVK